jgi:hypothetical protein
MPKSASPIDEDLLAAEPVAQDAPGEQQRREHEDVRVDRPDELALEAPRSAGSSGARC